MARARVILRHCESFTGLTGESWRKNQSRTITDAKQIALYKSLSEFVVSDLADAPMRKKAATSTPGGQEGPPSYSKSALQRMNKEDLVKLGADQFKLALLEEDHKDDLVAALLEVQG